MMGSLRNCGGGFEVMRLFIGFSPLVERYRFSPLKFPLVFPEGLFLRLEEVSWLIVMWNVIFRGGLFFFLVF